MAYSMLIPRVSLAWLAVLLLCLPAYAASLKPGTSMKITVAEATLKSSPHPFGGTIIARLAKGTKVTYLGSSGIYYQVSDGRQQGYVATRSVIEAGKFQSFSRGGQVTQSDMAAATKGFSPEVERENRKNVKLRYDLMDRAERQSTVQNPGTALKSFRQSGRLGEYAHD